MLKMHNTQGLRQGLSYPLALAIRESHISTLPISGLHPSNDAGQREYRQQAVGRKLLAIVSMFALIAYLVWSMG
jgi:hypothetical protein